MIKTEYLKRVHPVDLALEREAMVQDGCHYAFCLMSNVNLKLSLFLKVGNFFDRDNFYDKVKSKIVPAGVCLDIKYVDKIGDIVEHVFDSRLMSRWDRVEFILRCSKRLLGTLEGDLPTKAMERCEGWLKNRQGDAEEFRGMSKTLNDLAIDLENRGEPQEASSVDVFRSLVDSVVFCIEPTLQEVWVNISRAVIDANFGLGGEFDDLEREMIEEEIVMNQLEDLRDICR